METDADCSSLWYTCLAGPRPHTDLWEEEGMGAMRTAKERKVRNHGRSSIDMRTSLKAEMDRDVDQKEVMENEVYILQVISQKRRIYQT